MVKFFICSDFQLEKFDYSTLYNTDLFPDPKDIDILFIVGDLGELKYEEHYDHFIMTLTTAYKIVMLIPGNHEYYNITIKKGNIILENMKNKYHNFYVLNNNYFILEDIIFYGSTLWSDVTSVKKLPRKVPILNDENKKINIDEWKELHNISINSLKEIIQISKELNKKLVVLTHYCPYHINTTPKKYHGDISECLYKSNLTEYFKDIFLWAYGHTGHNSQLQNLNGMILYTNQYDAKNYNNRDIFNI